MKNFNLLFGAFILIFLVNTHSVFSQVKFVVDGKVIKKKTNSTDPGTIFPVKGTNISGFNWNWDFRNNLEDSLKIINVWKFNTVRINCFINSFQKSSPRYWNTSDDSKLSQLINYFTKNGVVCMIEVHDYTGTFPGDPDTKYPTQQYFNDWWKAKANEYKNNQYVWFNIMNEPGYIGSGDYASNTAIRDKWKLTHRGAIEAIRSTGATNIIVIDAVSFGSEAVGYGTVIDATPHKSNTVTNAMSSIITDGAAVINYDTQKNIVFALHPYTGWDTPGKFDNFMNLVSQAGMPVIVGEMMPSFRYDGGVGWKAGWASRAMWETLKYYRTTGTTVSSGWMIWHWDGAGGQKLSYNNGASSANTTSGNTRPTNLSREGYWVWDQLHNNTITDNILISSTVSTRLEMEQAMGWKDAYEASPNNTGTDDRYTGGTDATSWTEWDVDVKTSKQYKFVVRGYNKATTNATMELRDYAGKKIASVIIPANTSSDKNFTSASFSLTAGKQILRLVRMEALDAQYTYIDIVPDVASSINRLTADEEAVKIFPNPASEEVTINYTSSTAETTEFIISDMLSRIVKKQLAQLRTGTNEIKVNVSDLEKGLYTIQFVSSDKERITKKLITH